MQISEKQLEQVNRQIQRLIAADNFYGKRLKEAGVDAVATVEDFLNLPFSEKEDLRGAYPLGLMTCKEEDLQFAIREKVPEKFLELNEKALSWYKESQA